MEEIKVDVQGIGMAAQIDGAHHLILIALNPMQADILHQTLGQEVILGYQYDGADITFYLVIKLPGINKMFSLAVNASTATRKWLTLIDVGKVRAINVAYRDGKGSTILLGKPVRCSAKQ